MCTRPSALGCVQSVVCRLDEILFAGHIRSRKLFKWAYVAARRVLQEGGGARSLRCAPAPPRPSQDELASPSSLLLCIRGASPQPRAALSRPCRRETGTGLVGHTAEVAPVPEPRDTLQVVRAPPRLSTLSLLPLARSRHQDPRRRNLDHRRRSGGCQRAPLRGATPGRMGA